MRGGRILSGDGSIDEVWQEVSQTVFQTVRIGSRVRLQDESGTEVLYTITSGELNGHLNGGCRLPSALLRALLGRRVGEEVHVWTSSGGWRVTILEVD
jgi:transcription elongation GreA/GreB family factor